MDSTILATIKQICEEKNIPMEAVIETIEHALAAAYRKDFGEKNQNIKTEFDPETANVKVFDVKTVVEKPPEEEMSAETEGEEKESEPAKKEEAAEKPEEEKTEEGEIKKRFNPKTEITLEEAKKLKKKAKLGDVIKTSLEIPSDFGRMAAQTAKQVIIQRLREAERDAIYKEFKEKEGKVINGVVQRREGRMVLVDLSRGTGVVPMDQQIEREFYSPGQKLKFFILAVNQSPKGPEIILSRTHPEIVKELFILEIPEIAEGTVVIKGVSREAGSRSKIAVASTQESIDPIGSCVGQKGVRIQTIISELNGEKIDVIEYDDDPAKFISKALAPAKISGVKIDKNFKNALVKVKGDQFSLAIGKGGQNVRLAAQLTGWKISIEEEKPSPVEKPAAEPSSDVSSDSSSDVSSDLSSEALAKDEASVKDEVLTKDEEKVETKEGEKKEKKAKKEKKEKKETKKKEPKAKKEKKGKKEQKKE